VSSQRDAQTVLIQEYLAEKEGVINYFSVVALMEGAMYPFFYITYKKHIS